MKTPKERPIIFSTLMVQRLLAGEKTQTRRLVKACYQEYPNVTKHMTSNTFVFHEMGVGEVIKCPHGDPGDILYVKETFARYPDAFAEKINYVYKAGLNPEYAKIIKWTPSIFMPKEASRIKLLIKDRWVERLNDISEEDAIAEGVNSVEKYIELWKSLHGPDSWSKNPWVWVTDFKIL